MRRCDFCSFDDPFLVAHKRLQDIIQKQIELHANYALKTEYSKDKYKKRKEAK